MHLIRIKIWNKLINAMFRYETIIKFNSSISLTNFVQYQAFHTVKIPLLNAHSLEAFMATKKIQFLGKILGQHTKSQRIQYNCCSQPTRTLKNIGNI